MLNRKLVETCESKTDTVEHFLQGLDQSQWLKHVKAVLEASVFISEVNITNTQRFENQMLPDIKTQLKVPKAPEFADS